MRESLYNQVRAVTALPVDAYATDAAVNGATVDLGLGKQNYRTVLFVLHTGTVTDGTHAITVEDSTNGSAWAAADAGLLSGVLPTLDDTTSDTVREVGYKAAGRRYVRLVVTTAESTSGGTFGAVALLGQPSSTPVAH